ncbi:prostaglandin D2 receptor isoform X1 [Dromaius novaehollandiae]|uniref:prostaglandin D2 receptor isoform X1 n=1 Tax=Dromaius novaehollandiae TaxID=8790 RepID=UPI0031203BC0
MPGKTSATRIPPRLPSAPRCSGPGGGFRSRTQALQAGGAALLALAAASAALRRNGAGKAPRASALGLLKEAACLFSPRSLGKHRLACFPWAGRVSPPPGPDSGTIRLRFSPAPARAALQLGQVPKRGSSPSRGSRAAAPSGLRAAPSHAPPVPARRTRPGSRRAPAAPGAPAPPAPAPGGRAEPPRPAPRSPPLGRGRPAAGPVAASGRCRREAHGGRGVPVPQQPLHRERAVGGAQLGALRRRAAGQCAGAAAAGAAPAALADARRPPAAGLRLLRAGERAGRHRPAGQVPAEPHGAGRLRLQPQPQRAVARRAGRGRAGRALPALRLPHGFLRAGAHAAAAGHGPGVLAVAGPPLLLPAAPHEAPGGRAGAGGGRAVRALLRAAAAGLRRHHAVLPGHLVLHPHGRRRDAPARLPRALRQPAGAAGAGHRRLQREQHAAPVRHGAAAAPPRAARRRAAHGGARPPAAAGAHDLALHRLLAAAHRPGLHGRLRRRLQRDGGPQRPALPLRQLHRGPLGLHHLPHLRLPPLRAPPLPQAELPPSRPQGLRRRGRGRRRRRRPLRTPRLARGARAAARLPVAPGVSQGPEDGQGEGERPGTRGAAPRIRGQRRSERPGRARPRGRGRRSLRPRLNKSGREPHRGAWPP